MPDLFQDFISHGDLYINPSDLPLFRAAGLDSLDALLSSTQGTLLAKPGLEPGRERIRLEFAGQTYYLKRYDTTLGKESGWGGYLPMGRECWWLLMVKDLGIPCPRIVAFGYKILPARRRRIALVTAAVPGISLERWLANPVSSSSGGDPSVSKLQEGLRANRALRLRLLTATADLVRRLHAANLYHRDLYLSHIFLDLPDELHPHLTFIDFQRMIQPLLFRTRWRVKDLAALHFSTPPVITRADRLRWFKTYRGITRLRLRDRWLLRWITARARLTARRAARRAVRRSSSP